MDANLVRAGAIGPAPGGSTYYALEYYKQLVPNAEVTLPARPARPAIPKELSPANTWTPQNLAALVERLGGAIVVTHSQSGIMGHHMARILKERGHLDLLKGLMTLEGSCSLPNSGLTAADFDNIPYMALKGDYTATSTVCEEPSTRSTRAARQAGNGQGGLLKLDDMGILGVTHMMMLDKKNLEIADIMLGWVKKNVRGTASALTHAQAPATFRRPHRASYEETVEAVHRRASIASGCRLRARTLRRRIVRGTASRGAASAPDADKQWTMPNKNQSATRYSALNEINTENVKNLKVAWSFSTGVCAGTKASRSSSATRCTSTRRSRTSSTPST